MRPLGKRSSRGRFAGRPGSTNVTAPVREEMPTGVGSSRRLHQMPKAGPSSASASRRTPPAHGDAGGAHGAALMRNSRAGRADEETPALNTASGPDRGAQGVIGFGGQPPSPIFSPAIPWMGPFSGPCRGNNGRRAQKNFVPPRPPEGRRPGNSDRPFNLAEDFVPLRLPSLLNGSPVRFWHL